MIQTPTTELDAVNLMLESSGEPPVNSLEETEGTEAALAVRILAESSRRIQQEGCSFNTAMLRLLPDKEGEVPLPTNTLKVTPVDRRYVERGRKLFDRMSGSFTIGEPVMAEVVLCLGFDDIPEAARYYIAVTAARRFASRVLGSGELVSLTERDEAEARLAFRESELDANRPMLFSPLDNRMISRESSPHDRGMTCL